MQARLSFLRRACGAIVGSAIETTSSRSKGDLVEAHLARFHARDVEDAGDELQQLIALLHHRAHVLALLVVELAGDALEQHLRVADDRGERRAQLVRDGGEEVGLDAIGLLQPLDRLRQAAVLLGQLAVGLLDGGHVHARRHRALDAVDDEGVGDAVQVRRQRSSCRAR